MRTRQSSRKNKDGADTTVSVVRSDSGVDKSSRPAESCGLEKRRSTREKRRTNQSNTPSRRSKRLEQKERRPNKGKYEGSNVADRNTSETSSSNAEHDEATTTRMSGGNDDMVHGGASMDVETDGNGLDSEKSAVGGKTVCIDGTSDAMEDRDTNTSMDVEVGRIASEPKDSYGTDITLGIAGNDSGGNQIQPFQFSHLALLFMTTSAPYYFIKPTVSNYAGVHLIHIKLFRLFTNYLEIQ